MHRGLYFGLKRKSPRLNDRKRVILSEILPSFRIIQPRSFGSVRNNGPGRKVSDKLAKTSRNIKQYCEKFLRVYSKIEQQNTPSRLLRQSLSIWLYYTILEALRQNPIPFLSSTSTEQILITLILASNFLLRFRG